MTEQYSIMHLDRRVATIRRDGSCTVYAPSFLPYNLVLAPAGRDDADERINNLENFFYWCSSRVLQLDRKYAKEILNSLGAKQAVTDRERARIALSYHCLTLTDVYWTKGFREAASYAEINLLDHSLSDAFVDVSLRGKPLTAQNAALIRPLEAARDVSTQGVAPKAWVRRDGTFYLYKDGDPTEVEAELLASRIARCFEVDQVLYEPAEYDGQRVSASRLMTDREHSLVPMSHVEIYAANHDTTIDRLVNRYDSRAYCMMNIVDYLVGNTDRHWGNWGFLVDNRTNKPLRLFPLMDFNQAFRAYDTLEGARCLTTPASVSQLEAARDAVRRVGLNQRAEIRQEWFRGDHERWDMFSRRLAELKKI